MKASLHAKGAARLQARLKQRATEANRVMRQAMVASVADVEAEIVKRTPVDRGRLRGSIATKVEGTGTKLTGRIFVQNPGAAAVAMEVGRKPGKMPPVKPIEGWVRRKGIASGKGARQVAFLVARKIGRSGIKGRHMFRDGTKAAMPRVRRRFSLAFRRLTR